MGTGFARIRIEVRLLESLGAFVLDIGVEPATNGHSMQESLGQGLQGRRTVDVNSSLGDGATKHLVKIASRGHFPKQTLGPMGLIIGEKVEVGLVQNAPTLIDE